MNKKQVRLQAKLTHFISRNAARLKVVAGVLGILAVTAFGLFGSASAQSETFVKTDDESSVQAAQESNVESDSIQSSLTSSSVADKQLCVYICGQIASPGVYYLDEGSRVCDVVERAQGFLEDASPESLNLAREIQDGEQITVPSKEEASGVSITTSAQAMSASSASSLINVNTANATELEEIPGIGPSLAQRIITYRAEQGSFKSIDELENVSGIGSKKIESMRAYVCV